MGPYYSQTAATPVTADYVTKRRIADALRAQAEAGRGLPRNSPTIEAGNQVMVNYGGILENALAPWMAGKREKEAASAEAEAQAARQQALQGLLYQQTPGEWGADGMGPQTADTVTQREVSPEMVIGLQELGVDPSMLKSFLPEKPAFGAVAQAMNTPAGIQAAVRMKIISPEEGEAAMASLAERERLSREGELSDYEEKLRLGAKYRPAPYQPQVTPQQKAQQALLDATTPEEYERAKQTLIDISAKVPRGSTAEGGGGRASSRTPNAENINRALEEMDSLINDPDTASKVFNTPQAAIAWSRNFSTANPSNALASLLSLGTAPFENAEAAKLRQLGQAVVMEQIKALFPASNVDIAGLQAQIPNPMQSPEAASAYIEGLRAIYNRGLAGEYGSPAKGTPEQLSDQQMPDDDAALEELWMLRSGGRR